MFDIKSDTKEFTRKLKLRERFWGVEYDDESLVKSKSNINFNTAIPELSNILNILEQIEPTINDVNDSLIKQERRALTKELQEDQDLVIRKTDKCNTLVLMEKDYYCNILVMKHHLNTSTYQKIDSNSNKRIFNNLKFLVKTTNLV